MAKAQQKTSEAEQMKKEDKGITAKTEAIPIVPTVTYTVDDINKVMQYLGTRPYNEVAGLIQLMQTGKSS